MSKTIATFPPSRQTYVKEHVMLAALGAVLLTGLLLALGNPDPWVGVVGSVLAIALRGSYAMKEQLGMVWSLTETALVAPDGRKVPLADIETARHIFSALQVITRTGEKHLIKYQRDPASRAALIEQTRDAALSRS